MTLALVGAVAILVGWEGASQTDRYNHQLIWIAVASGGLITAGAGAGVWLAAGFRNVRDRMLAVPDASAHLLDAYAAVEPEAAPRAVLQRVTGLVAAPGMTLYHRADCLLVAGKSGLAPVDDRSGLRPCGVCAP